MSQHSGWIGVDLDGTLAEYDGWKGISHVGKPIAAMVDRVKAWLTEGQEVRIFTARVSGPEGGRAAHHIKLWLLEQGLPQLEITCLKDYQMVELWDDRAVQVIPNTGRRADGRD